MWTSLLAARAFAGACCVGSTSATPGQVGECETALVALGLGAEAVVARWDDRGAVRRSSLSDLTLAPTLAAGARWARWGQINATLPVRATWRGGGGLADAGFGVGDLSATVVLDPTEERWDAPAPVLTLGARVPTGRDWREASGPLLADVTGLPDAALLAGVALERTLGRLPWSLALDADVPFGTTPAQVGASASVGRYLGGWTALATLRHVEALPVAGKRAGTARTSVGGRLVYGVPGRWRAWATADGDLALPWLGRSQLAAVRVGGGVALVR